MLTNTVQKARVLLKKFGSIKAVLLSSVEELAQTNGIGRKTAQGIKQMVMRSHTERGNEEESSFSETLVIP